MMAVWNDYRLEGIDGRSKPGFAFSTDGGNTWVDSVLKNGSAFIDGFDPSCVFGRGDTAYYCYVRDSAAGHGLGIYLARTTNLGASWPLDTPLTTNGGADKPYMAIDNTGGTRDGYLYASWYIGNAVKFALSRNRGVTDSVQTIDSTSAQVHSPIP